MFHTVFHQPIAVVVYFHPEAGTGSAGDGTGGTPAAGTGTGGSGAAAPPATEPAGAQPAEKTFTYKEDRSAWIDPERHKKTEHLVNRTASELDRLRAVLAERDRQIAAITGVRLPTADETEAQKIADAFYALPQFAHLRNVTPELLTRVAALLEEGSSIAEARDHVWNAHTDRFLSRLDEHFASEIGVEKLTPGQQKKLHAAFGALIPDEHREAEAYGTFKRRYEAGDEQLITDFVKEYVADMLEPARRQATVMTTRRPVPRSGPAAPVVMQKQKPDYAKMGSVQEMLDAAEKEAEALGR